MTDTNEPDTTWQPDLPEMPLSVHLVGNGPTPTIFSVWDRKDGDNGKWSFVGMTLVERAALRALCEEAIRMIGASAPTETMGVRA